jgi:hypothetical protein
MSGVLKAMATEKLSGSMNKSLEVLVRELGFEPSTKLLMIHADDAGLAHSENMATIEALQKGVVNSYSIMVPCPWFYEMAEFALRHPEFDYGIHLTVTCEWNSYKFGPVLGQHSVPSLTDEQGFFFKNRKDVVDNAKLQELKDELCAQIDRALAIGLQPSHLDSHMYTLGASLEFLELYREIGRQYRLPVLLNSSLIREMSGMNNPDIDLSEDIEVDHMLLGQFNDFSKGKLRDYYIHALTHLQPGFNVLLIHPAHDNEEMKAVTRDHPNFGAEWRQIDLEFFTSDQCKTILREQGIQMVNWTQIKNIKYP